MLAVPTVSPGNVIVVAESLTADAFTPVPVNPTVCGLPGASSDKLRLPLRAPTAPAVKVTCTVQTAREAKVVPQSVVSEKSPLFVPVKPIVVNVTVCEVEFVIVKSCAAEAAPTAWFPKSKLPGEIDRVGIRISTVPESLSATAIPNPPPVLKLPISTPNGKPALGNATCCVDWKVPSPLPKIIPISFVSDPIAKSIFPSALKSPAPTVIDASPIGIACAGRKVPSPTPARK